MALNNILYKNKYFFVYESKIYCGISVISFSFFSGIKSLGVKAEKSTATKTCLYNQKHHIGNSEKLIVWESSYKLTQHTTNKTILFFVLSFL